MLWTVRWGKGNIVGAFSRLRAGAGGQLLHIEQGSVIVLSIGRDSGPLARFGGREVGGVGPVERGCRQFSVFVPLLLAKAARWWLGSRRAKAMAMAAEAMRGVRFGTPATPSWPMDPETSMPR